MGLTRPGAKEARRRRRSEHADLQPGQPRLPRSMTLRRTPAPPRDARDAATQIEAPDAAAELLEDEALPLGVEPWSGEEMPSGTASSRDLYALGYGPDPATSDAFDGDAPEAEPAAELAAPSLAPDPESLEISADEERNYRQIYESRFRQLDVGLREQAARHASGNILFALCLDPAPAVVSALLENPRFGLDHARSLAQYHPTDRGLEILARRAQFLRDSHVQRRVLGNIQTPDVVLDRVLRFKRLIDVYRLSIDRDLPERNRVRVRSRLRPIFTRAEPEDRAALIIKTEGRCLVCLAGCTFDARLTQLLCNHTIVSTLFIQNLARFGATPPALISKLLRSPAVQRQPQLRALLSKHPNAGGDAKRRP
jgi:hypothetical protein